MRRALEEELGVKLARDDEAARARAAFGVGDGRVDYGGRRVAPRRRAARAKKARRGLRRYEKEFGDRRAAFEAVDAKKRGAIDARGGSARRCRARVRVGRGGGVPLRRL